MRLCIVQFPAIGQPNGHEVQIIFRIHFPGEYNTAVSNRCRAPALYCFHGSRLHLIPERDDRRTLFPPLVHQFKHLIVRNIRQDLPCVHAPHSGHAAAVSERQLSNLTSLTQLVFRVSLLDLVDGDTEHL